MGDIANSSMQLLDLPKAILMRMMSYCSYEEVCRLRAVCNTFRTLGNAFVNDALFSVKERVETRLRAMRPLLQQFAAEEATSPWEPLPGEALLVARCAKLLTLHSELNLLHAVVARWVQREKIAFSGGRVLDLVRAAANDREADADFDVRAVSLLFFYNGAYLDHFESSVEPRLAFSLNTSAQRFGPKVVDLLCCSLFAGYQYIMAYDGAAVNVMGVFDVVGRGVTVPPRGARTFNDDARCREFVRYLRSAIRWTNLTGVLDAARDGRAADVLRAMSNTTTGAADGANNGGGVDVLPASLQKALGESLGSDDLLYERLFRRQLDRPQVAEGYTVSVDLKCPRTAMPALLRRQVDTFDSTRAREARAEVPERDPGARDTLLPPAPLYEFTMVLRARHFQTSREDDSVFYPPDLGVLGTRLDILSLANPRRLGPLLESELSMYQRGQETTLVPGPTAKRVEPMPNLTSTASPRNLNAAANVHASTLSSSRSSAMTSSMSSSMNASMLHSMSSHVSPCMSSSMSSCMSPTVTSSMQPTMTSCMSPHPTPTMSPLLAPAMLSSMPTVMTPSLSSAMMRERYFLNMASGRARSLTPAAAASAAAAIASAASVSAAAAAYVAATSTQ